MDCCVDMTRWDRYVVDKARYCSISFAAIVTASCSAKRFECYDSDMSTQNIHLFLTSEHDCGYLPGRSATNLVPDPKLEMDMALYSQLIELGYRRSGAYTYRPHCNQCQACQACRIPVKQFVPGRSQRRCLTTNSDLTSQIIKAGYSEEHFQLYQRYINSRHADGDMANPSPNDFKSFLYSEWSDTIFIEVRKQQKLIACAVTDCTLNGLSAVYSYFDPDENRRGLGTFCILQQIQHTQTLQQAYLYMGYWIQNCRKMEYKARFRPLEVLQGNRWKTATYNREADHGFNHVKISA